MKITLIGPIYPFRGGIARVNELLLSDLEGQGHQVQMVTFRRLYPRWLYPGHSDRDPTRRAVPFAAHYLLDTLQPWTWIQTTHQIQSFHPDVVIFTWWTTFLSPLYWVLSHRLRRSKIPIVFLIHNVIPHEPRFFDRRRPYRRNIYPVFKQKARKSERIADRGCSDCKDRCFTDDIVMANIL